MTEVADYDSTETPIFKRRAVVNDDIWSGDCEENENRDP
jgi:hypothetical protein